MSGNPNETDPQSNNGNKRNVPSDHYEKSLLAKWCDTFFLILSQNQ